MKSRRKTTVYVVSPEGAAIAVRAYPNICGHKQRLVLKDGCKQAKQNPRCAALDPEDAAKHEQHNRKAERRFMSNGFRNKEHRRLELSAEGVPTK